MLNWRLTTARLYLLAGRTRAPGMVRLHFSHSDKLIFSQDTHAHIHHKLGISWGAWAEGLDYTLFQWANYRC